MKKPTMTVGILVSLYLFLPFIPVIAAENSAFDPNFIISDEEMQDANSMTRGDIQTFLKEKGGFIATLKTLDASGKRRKTSEIIYRAAKEYTINPKYILVKLQKEQSLITDPDPTQKQLDWATGYGVCDSCKTDDEKIQKYKGFGTQVDNAAGIMRWYYDHVTEQAWIKRPNIVYAIDTTEVKPANFATAFLYTYTPHLNGNENFWKLWQQWFDQIYPDGTLVKTEREPIVYVLQNKKKRPFSSMTALTTRYDPKRIIMIPESELARYELGTPITLPNYSVLQHEHTYYLLDDDTLRPFSEETRKKLGFHPDEILSVSAEDIAPYRMGGEIQPTDAAPLGKVVRVKGTQSLFYIKDNIYYPLVDETIAKINFPELKITSITLEALNKLEESSELILLKDGTLLRVKGSTNIYVVEHGKKRRIPSEDVFLNLGYEWSQVISVNDTVGLAHPSGAPLTLRRPIAMTASENIVSTTVPSTPASDLLQRTPKEETVVIGIAFETPMDVYAVADYDTGNILAGKNIDVVRPMASLAKVMTGYQLLKEGIKMDNVTTFEPATHKETYHNYRIAEGEKVKNKDLMDAMLISSVNTPARMLVSNVESNESEFIKKMNGNIASWGLSKTRIADVSGVELASVTTGREYATLFEKAIRLPKLRTILGKKSYEYKEILDIDGKPNHADTHSNDLALDSSLSYRVLASKTGYLEEAGTSLVMLVERKADEKRFILVTMGNPESHKTKKFDEPKRFSLWAMKTF